ncbi:MFS general substrate transporter [Polyplosphaeria fusca]|uniref:MFS general substrate transporter n=1 Tax=Polyplosphaeria fusca TaxID=682080 RepID=A0A9P4UXZ4_9PLEO|nr:MFS general substrate transporter [Polyplosphaeria fusca]
MSREEQHISPVELKKRMPRDPFATPPPEFAYHRYSESEEGPPPTFVEHPPPIERPSPPGPPQNGEGESTYPSRGKTALIMFALYISIFLVALDRTILGPAIPAITNQFKSLSDVGWYGSGYMLTSCAFILLYGRVYTFFSIKKTYLFGIVVFEIGSAICGAAPSSKVLIIGRAISGLGAAGIFTGAILIMLNVVPLHKRPMLQGLFGACFGVASVAGPLIGGAFTGSKATWRWCFYINLPLGAITIAAVVFFVHLEERKRTLSWKETFFKLDPLGTILFLPSITCLLLALEWGGIHYAWSDGMVIALLTVFAVLLIAFVAWQAWTRHTTATVPARIVLQRSVAFGSLSQFFVGSTMLTVSLYIPLWFQAIKNTSAMKSGINTIPLVLSVVVGSIMSGGLTQRIGYYTPFMIFGACFMAIGAGLLTTWTASTDSPMWIGYQILLGFGVGCSMQHPNLAVQIVLPKPDVPSGTAILSFAQTLGGAVFVAVGQNLFLDKFQAGLGNIPGVDVHRISSAGATEIQHRVPPQLRPAVISAYNRSLTQGPFFAALIVACLMLPSALGMEWRSVKEEQQGQGPPAPPQDEESGAAGVDNDNVHSRTDLLDAAQPEPVSPGISEKDSLPPRPQPAATGMARYYNTLEDRTRAVVQKMNPDLDLTRH